VTRLEELEKRLDKLEERVEELESKQLQLEAKIVRDQRDGEQIAKELEALGKHAGFSE